MKRNRFDAAMDKRSAVNKADKSGEVADSTDVRMNIMKRIHSGEITLKEGQSELKKIKRDAKKNGKLTKQQVWSRS